MTWGNTHRIVAAGMLTLVTCATAGCAATAAPANVSRDVAANATAIMVAAINDVTAAVGTGWELPDGTTVSHLTVTDLDEGECQGRTALGTNDQDPKGFYDQAYLDNDTSAVTPAVKQRIRAALRQHHLTDISEAAQSETTTAITATGTEGTTPKVQVIYPTTGTGPVTIRGFSLCHRG